MRGWAALLAVLFAVPSTVAANSLTLEFRPSTDMRRVVSCTVQLTKSQMVVVEMVGQGYAIQSPLRWPATEADTGVLMDALTALVSHDIVSVDDPNLARSPAPPFVSVIWMADMTDGLQSGLYMQQGFDLPQVLDQVVNRLLFGGPCAAALAG